MEKYLKLIRTLLLVVVITSCSSTTEKSVIIHLLPVRSGIAFRYIDLQGKTIINPQFREATVIRNGLALVQLFGSKPVWGFIHEDGSFGIKAAYKEATVFSDEVAWVVSDNGAPIAINLKGDSLFTLKEAKTVRIFKNGLAAYSVSTDSVNVKWGFVYKNGTVRIVPQFSAVGDFSDGKCAVANLAGEWGFIDQEGKVVINFQFTNARGFKDGKAIVQSGKEWGVIDGTGKFAINPVFSEMKADMDQYVVKQNNKWGWCDQSGKITIQPQFAEALLFNGNDLAPVKTGSKFGFINRKGKLIIDARFDTALPFNGGIAWVTVNGKGGFIDKDAKYIVQPQYDAISEDFKTFLLTGGSTFESVNSDYFNLEAIDGRMQKDIQPQSVAGINFNTHMSLILSMFKKTEADFIKNATEHKIISAERISNDATLDFFILGTPWNETYNGKLGFSYSLKDNYIHTGFSYRINLTGKGMGKEDVVLKSFDTALTGYTKDEKHSNENVTILQNKFQLIICLKQKGNVIVAIYPLTPENIQMVELNYGNGEEPDSTSLVSDTVSTR